MTQQSDKTKEEILKESEKFYDNKRVIKAALLAMEKYSEQEVGKVVNKLYYTVREEVSHAYKVGRISGITKGVTVTGAIAIVIILTLILCL